MEENDGNPGSAPRLDPLCLYPHYYPPSVPLLVTPIVYFCLFSCELLPLVGVPVVGAVPVCIRMFFSILFPPFSPSFLSFVVYSFPPRALKCVICQRVIITAHSTRRTYLGRNGGRYARWKLSLRSCLAFEARRRAGGVIRCKSYFALIRSER